VPADDRGAEPVAVVVAASGAPVAALGTVATEPPNTARPLDVARSLLDAGLPLVLLLVLLCPVRLRCTSGSSNTSGSRKPEDAGPEGWRGAGRLACGAAGWAAGAAGWLVAGWLAAGALAPSLLA